MKQLSLRSKGTSVTWRRQRGERQRGACRDNLWRPFKPHVAVATGVLQIVQSLMVCSKPEKEPRTLQPMEEVSSGLAKTILGEARVESSMTRTGEITQQMSM